MSIEDKPMPAGERPTRIVTKEARARDAAQAMRDYEAEKLAVLAKTARLRAQRLANPAQAVQPKKTKAPAKKVR